MNSGNNGEDTSSGPRVELRPIYEWTCDACGRDNICRPLPANPDSDEIREALELETWEQLPDSVNAGDWVMFPSDVECKFCESVYDTEDPPGFEVGDET